MNPETTALMIMDYQHATLDPKPEAKALIAFGTRAVAAMREAGGTVGFVRVALTRDDHSNVPASNRMFSMVAEQGRFLDGDKETAFHEAILPEPGDIVVRKSRVGAFSTTDLQDQLQERGITTLVLAGISTSGVVLSTVRDAADRDYELFVLADCIADADSEVHEILVERVFPRQATVTTVSEFIAMIGL